jgi:HK97 family phage major capsid protein
VGAKWSFNDAMLKAIKKLVDGNNRPLWVPGVAGNAPDTILGYPYVINNDIVAPAATGSKKSLVFGNPEAFVVRDVKDIVIVRLDELYALNGEVAFVAFSRSDSAVVDSKGVAVWQQPA